MGGQQNDGYIAASKEIKQWLAAADEDYIAARRLLLDGFLKQGLMLANTAVEKYFKTLFLIRGDRFAKKHDTYQLFKTACKFYPRLKVINSEFIQHLKKGYKLRYTDELEDGFDLYMQQTKIIVELDRTIFEIRKGFEWKSSDGSKTKLRLEFEIENKNPTLLDKNIMYGDCDANKIFTEKSKWIALLVHSKHSIIEGHGSDVFEDDGVFSKPGIWLGDKKP